MSYQKLWYDIFRLHSSCYGNILDFEPNLINNQQGKCILSSDFIEI